MCNLTDSLQITAYGGVTAQPSTVFFNQGVSASPIQLSANYTNPMPPIPDTSGINTGHTCTGSYINKTVGTGITNTSTTGGIGTPYQGSWHDGRLQMLFTAAELQAAGLQHGLISRINTNITSVGSTIPYANFTIKMGKTSDTTLSLMNGFLTSTDIVFSAAAVTPIVGLNAYNFTTPYFWNGIDNLLLEFCFDNTTASANDHVSYTETVNSSVLYQRMSWASGCSLFAAFASKNRPDIIFRNCAVAPQIATTTYNWISPTGTINNPTIANATATPNGAAGTTEFFIATASDGVCTSADTVTVINTIGSCGVLANIQTTGQFTCINNTGNLDAGINSIGTGALSFLWSNNATTPSISTTAVGIYTVTVTAAGTPNCTSTASVNLVSHAHSVAASISPAFQELTCSHPSFNLTATAIGIGNLAYVWDTNLVYSLGNIGIVATSGTYSVTVSEVNTGCTGTASIAITQNTTCCRRCWRRTVVRNCGDPALALRGAGGD